MKSRLYQVVKYGARLASALAVLVAIFVMAALIGRVYGFDCLGSIIRFMVPILDLLLSIIPMLIIFAPALLVVLGVFIIYRWRRQAAS
jgi:hypothetical protein